MNTPVFQGHSGCKLELTSNEILRKCSGNNLYNERLKIQMLKQKSFTSTEVIKSPRVFTSGTVDDLFYFEMEYINGLSFSDFIRQTPLNLSLQFFENLIAWINSNGVNNFSDLVDNEIIIKKLKSLDKFIPKKLSKTLLKEVNNLKIPKGYCHGDLTFENIIIRNSNTFLIDFLDSYIESPFVDISKLYQDIYLQWSWRNKDVNTLTQIKLNIFRTHLENRLDLADNNIRAIEFLTIINFLRIIPYSSSNALKNDLIKQSSDIVKQWK